MVSLFSALNLISNQDGQTVGHEMSGIKVCREDLKSCC